MDAKKLTTKPKMDSETNRRVRGPSNPQSLPGVHPEGTMEVMPDNKKISWRKKIASTQVAQNLID